MKLNFLFFDNISLFQPLSVSSDKRKKENKEWFDSVDFVTRILVFMNISLQESDARKYSWCATVYCFILEHFQVAVNQLPRRRPLPAFQATLGQLGITPSLTVLFRHLGVQPHRLVFQATRAVLLAHRPEACVGIPA